MAALQRQTTVAVPDRAGILGSLCARTHHPADVNPDTARLWRRKPSFALADVGATALASDSLDHDREERKDAPGGSGRHRRW